MNMNTEISLGSLLSTNNAFIRKRKRNSLSITRSNSEVKKLRQNTDLSIENKKGKKSNDHICSKKKRQTSKYGRFILPNKFLLGGNFKDPLNLNSLSDEKVSAVLNAITPIASPIPFKSNSKDVLIPVRIPANIHDPLNLCGQESEDILADIKPIKRRKKRRYFKKIETHERIDDNKLVINKPEEEIKLEQKNTKDERKIEDYKLKKVTDKIVSPVVPPLSPKWKRRRTSSDCRHLESDINPLGKLNEDSKKTTKGHERQFKNNINIPISFSKRNNSRRFFYGNYNNYIGYKNYDYNDARLESLPPDTFEDKDVLDIGCNVGYLSLAIATKYKARRVIGIDMDEKLIKAAKTNLLHYIDVNKNSSVAVSYQNLGPTSSHLLPLLLHADVDDKDKFPFNIHFKTENYVPHSEEILYSMRKEFDVILALGITKYIHLNYGDEALTRSFKKMYLQLRPGGRLILQAQQWRSYKKEKSTDCDSALIPLLCVHG